MKQTLSTLSVLFFAVALVAQVPQAFNYQGVARDLSGSPIPSQNIGLRIAVLTGSANGPEIYQETHNTITTNLGLFSLQIGEGTPVTGIFEDIDWGSDRHYLQIELDENGGNDYQLIGTSELLSVPYALYAANGSKWTQKEDSLYYDTGNVGIGFSSPGRLLHLQNRRSVIQVDRNASSPAIQFARFRDSAPFEAENYLLGFGIGVDNIGSSNGGYLFIGEDVDYDFSTGFGDGGVRLAVAKGGNIGIGTVDPKSKVHVSNGDIYIDDVESGVVMKSPNGQCWRMTVSDIGQPEFTAIPCPD